MWEFRIEGDESRMKKLVLSSILFLFAIVISACSKPLTLYTDTDKSSVIELVKPFTGKTGILVNVVGFDDARELADNIAVYSDGSYQIVRHQNYNSADVVFAADIAMGEALKTRGVLREYAPANAAGIPEGAKRDGWWYGMGGFAWVVAWNTDLVSENPPKRLLDLDRKDWPGGAAAMPNPNYMLYYTAGESAALGGDRIANFLNALIAKDTHWEASSAETAALVADGKAYACLTTLKEAAARKAAGAHIDWALPDQGEGEAGAYVQYNAVCLCTTATMPEQAKLLADYLLDPETEALSVQLGLSDITLRPCSSDALIAIPLKTDLARAQEALQNGLGSVLTYFTGINLDYKGK